MKSAKEFVDFYAILGVHPQCDHKTLEAAYRDLAKIYHPDHPDTADTEKFRQVVQAYRAIKRAGDRARYNEEYAAHTGFSFAEVNEGERIALSDADAHQAILMRLYRRRRDFARDAGVGQYELQQLVGCSDATFEFHIWYLKEKRLVAYTDDGTLAITIEGVEHIISQSQSHRREQLRISQAIHADRDDDELDEFD